MEGKIYDIVIIGGGCAGLTAAIYARRAEKSVLVLEKNAFGGQIVYSPEVENFPGFIKISGLEFSDRLYSQAKGLGTEFEIDNAVKILTDGEYKTVITDYGKYKCRAVIIAAGLTHRRLGLENEERLAGHGISYCAVCDGAFFKGKTVAVVGGGDVAIEDAIFLSRGCEKVYLIHRRDQLRGAESLQRELFARPNIEVIWDSKVTRILGEDQVESVHLKNTKNGEKRNLPVEGLFVAVGVVPCTTLIKGQVALDDFGYVKAREDCVTNIPGVFAAGDLRTKPMKQIVTAVADGANAVNSARNYLTEKE